MIIAAFWDDLNPGVNPGDVYHQSLGSAPNRRFVAQWDLQHFSSTPNTIRVQAVLYEGSNDIEVCYVDASFGYVSYDYGASATIGIQESSTVSLQYSCISPDLQDGLLIKYLHP